MKGVLIGCGVVLAIVVIVFVVIGYFGVKFVKDIGQDMLVFKETFQELNSKYPFEAPEDGLIRSGQYGQWMDVRKDMQGSIAGFDSLMQDFSLKSFQKIKDHTLNLVQDLTATLDTVGISPNEYLWISRQVAGALQSGDIRYDPDLQEIATAFDELMEREDDHGNRTNMRDLGVPVTSEQIAQIKGLIRTDKEAFLNTLKVFYADMAVYGFMHFEGEEEAQEEQESDIACVPGMLCAQ